MKQLRLSSLIIFCLTAWCSAELKDPVKIVGGIGTFNAPRSIIKVEVGLEIDEPWHVYSDSILPTYYIPLSLSLRDSSLGKMVKNDFPSPQVIEVVGEKLTVYGGKLKIASFFYLNSKPNYPIKISLKYQSCNNEMCLPPKQKDLSLYSHADGQLLIQSP